jgi:hypothetical protein
MYWKFQIFISFWYIFYYISLEICSKCFVILINML